MKRLPDWAEVENYKAGVGIRVRFNNGSSLHLTFAQNEQLMVVSSNGQVDVHACRNGAVCLAPTKAKMLDPKRETPEVA